MSKKARRRPSWKIWTPKKKSCLKSLICKTMTRIVQEEINREVIAAIMRTKRTENE